MPSINISDDGSELLEKIRDTFDVKPSKRKVVERALELYWEERKNEEEQSDEQTTTEVN